MGLLVTIGLTDSQSGCVMRSAGNGAGLANLCEKDKLYTCVRTRSAVYTNTPDFAVINAVRIWRQVRIYVS